MHFNYYSPRGATGDLRPTVQSLCFSVSIKSISNGSSLLQLTHVTVIYLLVIHRSLDYEACRILYLL